MTPQQFQSYLERDRHRCLHCGLTDTTLIPQHRKNRGMGGSKTRDVPSNIIVLCSKFNWLIEADAHWASVAKTYGWKLQSWQNPLDTPVYDVNDGKYYILDNEFRRREEKDANSQRGTQL